MKTCPKCGYTTENELAKFCYKCGERFPEVESQSIEINADSDQSLTQSSNVSNLSMQDETNSSHSDKVEPPIDTNSFHEPIDYQNTAISAEFLKENSEIGGWLAFFLFSICLGGTLSAIISFTQINSVNYLNNVLLALTDVSLGVMLCALAFYTLYSFIQRKPDAVYLGKLYVVTTFISNLLVLFNGDFESSGFGSLPQTIRGLVWGVIWYAFLCVSSRVEEVIPKEYRKKTPKDYYITGIIYLIPIGFFIAGLVTFQDSKLEQETQFAQSVQLREDERTDGKMIFKLPEGFSCESEKLEEEQLTVFNLENEDVGNITICSDYDNDMTQKNFNEYCNGWENENAKQFTSHVECLEKRTINGRTYWYKVTSYKTDGIVYWRFIMLFDNASGKVVVISAYDGGYDSYIEELLESIRFK